MRKKERKQDKKHDQIPQWYVVAMFLFLLHYTGSAQDQEEVIPDGTQGELLEVLKTDSVPQKWKDKRWRLFPGRFSTLKVGGGFLYEFAAYSPDQESKRQMDSAGSVLEPTFAVRDFRVTVSGQLKTKRTISWRAGFMYDGPSRSWFVRESGVMIDVPELWGKFFIGRTKEGFSLNKVMVGYAGWTMERQMAIDVIPILADGIKWLGYLPKQRILWNLGIYTDLLSDDEGFSTYEWQFASRVGWLPIFSESEKKIVHVGLNYRYGEPDDGDMRLRSRPEANPAPYFIDTGTFPASHSNQFGYEAYYRSGPLMLGSEVYWHVFNTPEEGNLTFNGGDVFASYMITGEARPYNTATGIFGFVTVNRPVFKGGPGAWEVLVRFSKLDLDAGSLTGGKFWRITPMVNWYLSKEVRLEIAYGYGVLDRFDLRGATHFFQSRIQLTLP